MGSKVKGIPTRYSLIVGWPALTSSGSIPMIIFKQLLRDHLWGNFWKESIHQQEAGLYQLFLNGSVHYCQAGGLKIVKEVVRNTDS